MEQSECSRSNTQETQRARPVAGGKANCCKCDDPHAPGSGYCAAHKAEYMRHWRKLRAAELERLRRFRSEHA